MYELYITDAYGYQENPSCITINQLSVRKAQYSNTSAGPQYALLKEGTNTQ